MGSKVTVIDDLSRRKIENLNQSISKIKFIHDDLIPYGQKIAEGICADFGVDWGHDHIIKEVMIEVFGKENELVNEYWKNQNELVRITKKK